MKLLLDQNLAPKLAIPIADRFSLPTIGITFTGNSIFSRKVRKPVPVRYKSLSEFFPGSKHVSEDNLGSAEDILVWEFALKNNFIIVTKDADFSDLSMIKGFPPKVIWIRRGNCSTSDIEKIIRSHLILINALIEDKEKGILTIF